MAHWRPARRGRQLRRPSLESSSGTGVLSPDAPQPTFRLGVRPHRRPRCPPPVAGRSSLTSGLAAWHAKQMKVLQVSELGMCKSLYNQDNQDIQMQNMAVSCIQRCPQAANHPRSYAEELHRPLEALLYHLLSWRDQLDSRIKVCT